MQTTIDALNYALANGKVTVRRVTPGDGQSAPYHAGKLPPNYPLPVEYDTLPDAEYLVMLYERALLTKELAELRNATFN